MPQMRPESTPAPIATSAHWSSSELSPAGKFGDEDGGERDDAGHREVKPALLDHQRLADRRDGEN